MKIRNQLRGQAAACLLIVILCLCGALPVRAEEIYDGSGGARCMDLFAMDTYMSLTAIGERADDALRAASAEIRRLDALLSTGNTGSEISALNREGGGKVSEDTRVLAEASLSLFKETDGLFDISIYPVMELWGFAAGQYQKPDDGVLKETLARVDASRITLAETEDGTAEIHFPKDMKIDLGGIAKGYTSARLMEIFSEYGITGAVVSLGGNVETMGTKPDGKKWRIGIQNPEGGDYLGILTTSGQAVITSGGYERYFEEDGVRYHHIIDPRTGYPADSGTVSVTVICGDGMLADGLSTSLYIMGEEEAEKFWRSSEESFEYIIETEDGVLHVTEGAAEDFAANRRMEVVKR